MKKISLLIFSICCVNMSGQPLTNRQIYDFEPGDVFQWTYTDIFEFPKCSQPYVHTYYTDSVIAKRVSINLDTIVYEIKRVGYQPIQCDPRLPPQYFLYNMVWPITKLDVTSAIGYPSCDPVSDTQYVSDVYCYKKLRAMHSNQSSANCFEPIVWSLNAVEGCGVYENYHEQGGMYYTSTLTYFRKSGKSCGIYVPVGISEKQAREIIPVYPNPSSGLFELVSDRQWQELSVYDVLGSQIMSLKPDQGKIIIDLNNQPPGIYFLRLTDMKNKIFLQKLVKQ